MIERTRIVPMTGERRTEFYGAVSFSRTRLAAAPDDDQACCGLLRLDSVPLPASIVWIPRAVEDGDGGKN